MIFIIVSRTSASVTYSLDVRAPDAEFAGRPCHTVIADDFSPELKQLLQHSSYVRIGCKTPDPPCYGVPHIEYWAKEPA